MKRMLTLFTLAQKRLVAPIFRIFTQALLITYFMPVFAQAVETIKVDAGRWNRAELAQIITAVSPHDKPGDRIAAISSYFLNTPYEADTLIGGPQKTEQLVLNLTTFDCFTFLDIVEALRRASSVDDFPVQLRQVRYFDGEVTYKKRRHFFSDWIVGDVTLVSDVTTDLGKGSAEMVIKQLNRKIDGSDWLSSITVTPREIHYIPTNKIDAQLLSTLQTGDYVGFYSEQTGLDVSHTGLIVKNRDHVLLRHASSRPGVERVVDEDLLAYLQGRAGLLVYRVKP